MYKHLLFDADNTLLDFDAAEHTALCETLSEFLPEVNDRICGIYHEINKDEWQKLECGETTREKLCVDRFDRFIKAVGADMVPSGAEINKEYTKNLAKNAQLMPYAEEILGILCNSGYDIYIVTNGTTDVQKSRMKLSPFEKYIKKSYISQEMGCAKPERIFFDMVIADIGDSDRSRYLVIGDSETSDIRGAVGAGIDSVRLSDDENVKTAATYTARDLRGLLPILT